jgi:hypothetical protein
LLLIASGIRGKFGAMRKYSDVLADYSDAGFRRLAEMLVARKSPEFPALPPPVARIRVGQ